MGLFKSNVKKISPEDAKTMMAEGDVTLLDVRRKEEYQNCFTISDKARCIAGSVLELVCRYAAQGKGE